MEEKDFKAYCAALLAALDMGDLDELDPIDVEEDENGGITGFLLMYGGPTLYLDKDKDIDGWTLTGSYGVCESLSSSAEDYLNDWIARTQADYRMYYA